MQARLNVIQKLKTKIPICVGTLQGGAVGIFVFSFCIWALYDLNLNIHPRRQRKVGQSVHNLRRRVHNINHSAMNPHLKLLSSILIDEGCAVHCIFLDFSRQRHWPNNFGVITQCGINDLLDRKIKDLVLVSHHSDAQFRNMLILLWMFFTAVFFFC